MGWSWRSSTDEAVSLDSALVWLEYDTVVFRNPGVERTGTILKSDGRKVPDAVLISIPLRTGDVTFGNGARDTPLQDMGPVYKAGCLVPGASWNLGASWDMTDVRAA